MPAQLLYSPHVVRGLPLKISYLRALDANLIPQLWWVSRLGVLPSNLNRLLIIVVVLSMALTPLLNELGRVLAKMIDEFTEVKEVDADAQMQIAEAVEPIVIIGFGQLGQVSQRVSMCYLICCFSYRVLVRMLGRN